MGDEETSRKFEPEFDYYPAEPEQDMPEGSGPWILIASAIIALILLGWYVFICC